MPASLTRPHAIIFDMNETLLDLAPLREAAFNKIIFNKFEKYIHVYMI